jgi:hypothetical protein
MAAVGAHLDLNQVGGSIFIFSLDAQNVYKSLMDKKSLK